ncbi:MAG: sialidase family protein [Salinibacter sp.]
MVEWLRPYLVGCVIGLVGGGGVLFLGEESSSASGGAPPADSALVEWQAPIQVATGAAFRGPWRMNDSDWTFVDDPAVALTEKGTIGVAWTDHTEQNLFFQRFAPDGSPQFKSPVQVSRSPEIFSWLPRVVFPNGDASRVYVLWQEIVFSGGTHGGEAFFARSTDGGRTFEAPINLSQSVAGDGKGRLTDRRWDNGGLDLAVGPEGTVYAAWTEYEGRLWIRRSVDGGRQFDSAVHVAGSDARPARGPSLAVGPEGTVHLVWATGGDPSADLRYARSGDLGRTFSAPTTIAESDGHSDAPSLAVDGDGTLHLAYAEHRTEGPSRYHLRYTHRADTARAFRASMRLLSQRSARVASRHYPTLRAGSRESLLVLWERFPAQKRRPQGLGMALSRNGGDSFSSPSLVPGSAEAPGFNGSQQGLLAEKVAVSEEGTVAVVNSTFDRGEESAIWLYRGQLPD